MKSWPTEGDFGGLILFPPYSTAWVAVKRASLGLGLVNDLSTRSYIGFPACIRTPLLRTTTIEWRFWEKKDKHCLNQCGLNLLKLWLPACWICNGPSSKGTSQHSIQHWSRKGIRKVRADYPKSRAWRPLKLFRQSPYRRVEQYAAIFRIKVPHLIGK